MSWLSSKVLEPLLKCPNCKFLAGHLFNFGKKGHCWNCRHIWNLSWRGGKNFSYEVKNQYV